MTEQEWLEGTDPKKMLEFLNGQRSDRKLQLFAVACSRRVLHLMVHPQSRRAVEIAEQFADGKVNFEELITALDMAWDLTGLPYDLAPDSRPPVGSWYAARAATGDRGTTLENALYTAWAAAAAVTTNGTGWDDPAWEKVLFAAWVRYYEEYADRWDDFFWEAPYELGCDDFVSFPSWVAERTDQAFLLRDTFGNPFRPANIAPAILSWHDSTIPHLAQSIYEESQMPAGTFDPARMNILADALLDAGCDNEDIIQHCRSDKPHVRGCWVVDLLLGKS